MKDIIFQKDCPFCGSLEITKLKAGRATGTKALAKCHCCKKVWLAPTIEELDQRSVYAAKYICKKVGYHVEFKKVVEAEVAQMAINKTRELKTTDEALQMVGHAGYTAVDSNELEHLADICEAGIYEKNVGIEEMNHVVETLRRFLSTTSVDRQ